jgi:hypothetical protein
MCTPQEEGTIKNDLMLRFSCRVALSVLYFADAWCFEIALRFLVNL